jgi:D-amino-acid dehydrogenase
MSRVAIVGAGIAGLGVARALARRGVDVQVFERGTIGSGATWGSAGWICPVQAGPLPEPGLISYGLRSLADRESALYLHPLHATRHARWLTTFALACNEVDYRRGVEALAALGYRAFELFDELVGEGVNFTLYKRGLVAAAMSEGPVRAFLRSLRPALDLGYDVPSEPMEGDRLRELEPSLSRDIQWGLRIRDHWHVDSGELAVALGAHLRETGVQIHERVGVESVVIEHGRARGLVTSAGVVDSDVVVLAAGVWTPPLIRSVWGRVPIVGGKGYSFAVRPHAMPTHAIYLLESHIGCSPLGDVVRVAGTMEFSGLKSPIDQRRVETMKRRARPLLGWDEGTEGEPWAGLRPIAPDGLPVIGRLASVENVFLASGYSMLGITVGLPAGELVAEAIVTGESPDALRSFSPDRFRRAWRRGADGRQATRRSANTPFSR